MGKKAKFKTSRKRNNSKPFPPTRTPGFATQTSRPPQKSYTFNPAVLAKNFSEMIAARLCAREARTRTQNWKIETGQLKLATFKYLDNCQWQQQMDIQESKILLGGLIRIKEGIPSNLQDDRLEPLLKYVEYLEILLSASLNNSELDISERDVFFAIKPKAIEIGTFLESIGGTALMRQALECLPRHDLRELEVVWDGIGDWRC